MKVWQVSLASALLWVSSITLAAEADEVVLDWLQLIDARHYEESWDQTAPLFQAQVSSVQWAGMMEQGREVLGELKSRAISTSTSHSSLPGAPDAEYRIVVLNSSFTGKASAVETVTVMKLENGWRTIGYFIR